MHNAVTWAAAMLAVALLAYGVVGLSARHADERARHISLGRCWLAIFVLVETCPGWPSGVVLALSLLAFVPLLLAVRPVRRG